MSTLHPTSTFNIEASVNKWVQEGLENFSRPSFLPAFGVVFNMPEDGLTPPCVSAFHIPVSAVDTFQGGRGDDAYARQSAGLVDLSAWVTRQQNGWNAHLMTMASMIESLAAGNPTIPVYDFLTLPGTPIPVEYRVVIRGLTFATTSPDENPDIERRRYLLRYEWNSRSYL